MVGTGKKAPSGHIPFTPRAKKTLELSLREALQLHHNYIGTEHILLGLIREGDGVAAQIMRNHADLLLDPDRGARPAAPAGKARDRRGVLRWLRRGAADPVNLGPAADPARRADDADRHPRRGRHAERGRPAGRGGAGRLASPAARRPGRHRFGRRAGARGPGRRPRRRPRRRCAAWTSPAPATSSRRTPAAARWSSTWARDRLTIEVTDPLIVAAGQAALRALGEEAVASGDIRGDQAACASLSSVWQALRDSLATIQQDAAPPEAAA